MQKEHRMPDGSMMKGSMEPERKGIMAGAMAMPEDETEEAVESPEVEAAEETAEKPEGGASADMVERVMEAALRVLETPQGKQELMAAAQSQDPEQIQKLAYSILLGIDGKTGQTLPEDVLWEATDQVTKMIVGLVQ